MCVIFLVFVLEILVNILAFFTLLLFVCVVLDGLMDGLELFDGLGFLA